ncbi:MAG: type 1 glutamine amidotransferase [Nitrospiraceae bacterium]|nr:type 1 glutamine amidotransferase [Nitrospiraceae bacterium]
MNVLIIKNASVEGPGTIGDHLKSSGAALTTVDLEAGQTLPPHDAFSHIVVMGGPMAVYEMDKTPYLKEEALLLERAIAGKKHVLGVCLGSQLLAHVLGARVYAGGAKEIGWYDVELTQEGMADRCMKELAVDGKSIAQVFQWHGDTFDLPQGAVRLASSPVYPNQAFRYSDRVYALQFHIEVSPVIVKGWLEHEKGVNFPIIDKRSQEIYGPYRSRAQAFYRSFFGA